MQCICVWLTINKFMPIFVKIPIPVFIYGFIFFERLIRILYPRYYYYYYIVGIFSKFLVKNTVPLDRKCVQLSLTIVFCLGMHCPSCWNCPIKICLGLRLLISVYLVWIYTWKFINTFIGFQRFILFLTYHCTYV